MKKNVLNKFHIIGTFKGIKAFNYDNSKKLAQLQFKNYDVNKNTHISKLYNVNKKRSHISKLDNVNKTIELNKLFIQSFLFLNNLKLR